jgi:negative regulator of sigma E activity
MSQHDRHEHEAISALMDNEADDLELRRLLKSCEKDPRLLQTWERYHLVQSLLHDSKLSLASSTLAARIASQLEQEAALAPVKTARFSGWQQHLSKLAIAASVAVVFVFGMQTQTAIDSSPSLAQQAPVEPVTLTAPETLVATETNTAEELDPAALQFLNEWIERMTFDEKAPVRTEHLQDSPLYRLVNQISDKPQ